MITPEQMASKLSDAHQRSVSAYLRRQQIEAERQNLAQQAMATDQELVRLDGEIAALTALQATLTPDA